MKKLLYILVFTAVVLRFSYIQYSSKKTLADDAAGYDRIAWEYVQTGSYQSYRRAPVYPLFLAGIYSVLGHDHVYALYAQFIIGLLTCALIFWMSSEISPGRIKYIALIISLYYPFFIYYTGELLIETLFVFLLNCALLFLIKLVKNKKYGYAVYAALFLSLSSLCKSVALPFSLLSIMLTVLVLGPRDIKTYISVIFMLAVLFLPLHIWGSINKRNTGHYRYTTIGGGRELLGSNYSYAVKVKGHEFREMISATDDPVWAAGRSMDIFERDKYYFREGMDYIKENPLEFAVLAFKKFIKFWRLYPTAEYMKTSAAKKKIYFFASILSYGLILPFSIIGIFSLLKNYRFLLYNYLLILVFTGLHMVFWAQIRYRLPLMPTLIILSAAGIEMMLSEFKLKYSRI